MHILEEGQYRAKLVHGIRRQSFRAVLQIEPFQALVKDTVVRSLTLVNLTERRYQYKTAIWTGVK